MKGEGMFLKKIRLMRNGTKIEDLQREVKALHDRVLRLECLHDVKGLIIEGFTCWTTGHYGGRKYCKYCGKTIEYYQDKASLLTARNKLMRELIAMNEKEMKGK
jgi:hypothetical protein